MTRPPGPPLGPGHIPAAHRNTTMQNIKVKTSLKAGQSGGKGK
jgi:hypothetical protein